MVHSEMPGDEVYEKGGTSKDRLENEHGVHLYRAKNKRQQLDAVGTRLCTLPLLLVVLTVNFPLSFFLVFLVSFCASLF